jgi:HEAT repeat protein
MRRALPVLTALAFATTATAATIAMTDDGAPAQVEVAQPESAGPDSARVVRFLAALAAADPLVCELGADPIGNFWFNDRDYGIGQFADTRVAMRAEKDSISRRVTDAGAIRALAARLDADDPCLRKVAAKMLGNSTVGDDALVRLLEGGPARVREAALLAAGERERPQLRARVERMLGASEASVAAMAAWTLGEFELKASVPALRRALQHDAASVRLAAANALGDIDDPAAAADLERLAERDADRRVRHVAIESLGNLERPSSMPVLARIVGADDMVLAVAAAEALGNINDVDSPPPELVRALESGHAPLRRAAIEAVVHFEEDPSLAPKLLPHITDPDAEVRVMVIEALGDMRARIAIPAIKKALTDANAEVRRAAVEALAEIEER